MTAALVFSTFTLNIEEISSRPTMIGALRPIVGDPVRRISQSEMVPPTSTPTDAPR